jgi:C4-dicarboxylate-specific signal transduction histidine kinase
MSQQPGSSAQSPSSASTPLTRALDQNEAIQDTVEQSATDLVMINVVLKQEVPDYVQVGDVAQALHKTDELESKIHDAALELAHVNEVLAHEIDERAELERELAQVKAALVREKA